MVGGRHSAFGFTLTLEPLVGRAEADDPSLAILNGDCKKTFLTSVRMSRLAQSISQEGIAIVQRSLNT